MKKCKTCYYFQRGRWDKNTAPKGCHHPSNSFCSVGMEYKNFGCIRHTKKDTNE